MLQGLDVPPRSVHSPDPEIAEVTDGSSRQKQPPQIAASGYVVRSLEADLSAFRDADFRQPCCGQSTWGDDADTTAAVCGQLAGTLWGEKGFRRNG